jgi:Tfp pilus assembly protein PilF
MESWLMTGTKRTDSKTSTKSKASKGTYFQILSGIALATTLMLPAVAAGTKPLPIERIGLDKAKQFVISFGSVPGLFPGVPSVLNLEGPPHRVVIQFTDAVIDKANMPTSEQLAAAICRELPAIKGMRFYNIANAVKPTARIVFDLPQDVKVDPRVVKLEESSVTISFGDAVQNSGASKKVSASAPVPVDGANNEAAMTSAPEEQTQTAAVASAPTTAPPAPAPAISHARSAITEAPVPTQSETPVTPETPVATETAVTTEKAVAASSPESAITAPATEAVTSPTSASSFNSATTSTAEATSMEPPLKTTPIAEEPTTTPIAAATEAPAPTTTAITSPLTTTPETTETIAVTPTTTASLQPATATPGGVSHSWDWSDSQLKKAEAANPKPLTSKTDDLPQPTSAPVDAAVKTSNSGAPVPSELALPSATTSSTTTTTTTVDTNKKSAVALYNSAVKNHLAGKLAEAIANYKAALTLNPTLEEAHSNLGLIYNQQHDYEAALNEFHKALAIKPKDAISYNGIGAALRAQKDLPGAIRNWQTAIDLDPKLATAHYNLGTAFEIQREYDKALESYKDAVRNDFHLGDAYYRMGLIMQRQNRLGDAEAQFQQALKVSGDSEYSEDARQRLASLKTRKTQ